MTGKQARGPVHNPPVGSPAKDRGHLLRTCTHCKRLFHGDYFAQLCPKHAHLNPIPKGRPPGPIVPKPRKRRGRPPKEPGPPQKVLVDAWLEEGRWMYSKVGGKRVYGPFDTIMAVRENAKTRGYDGIVGVD